ncbi:MULTISPECIES: aldehyde dehydrogenase family protein [Rhodococcus]|uniref:aldehyde dehydrogenase family protein n=1 Tax=Rhodococcus TaxID=1827 RepID=UPI001063BB50|nr:MULTISPECIES: aldehyde dehydrogenase family protein [Rhodococcus]MDI9941314.1 aldehyde dehydrogenase family protein [Rhodococcus sp. IEGM 1351]MDJ0418538.1 aldehyde dehydrogenase family protein [Rhodococcus opacus]NHU47776.1 aldehyde dehydrogenase family protein [Rhodococcus sp. A14]UZG52830.1 aldehyde dehydrogenase family protein [Rhodococcus opacus]
MSTRTAAPALAPAALADEVTWATAEQVTNRAASLRAAQRDWERSGARERASFLALFGRWLSANRAELEESMISETGKSQCDAALEIPLALQLISYYCRHAARFLAPERRRSSSMMFANKRVTVLRSAQPVVGIISPWNYPVANPLMDAIPALAAGCAVLIKPSELTPVTIDRIAEGWRTLGGPDVFAVVQGGADIGESVIDEADFVQFTGSSRTGRAILARAAQTLTPVSLELGGKDPMLVLADADLERAANAAVWGAMFNAGQTCVAVERVYVEAPVYDAFVDKVVAKTRALTLANGVSGTRADIGALIDERQLAIVDKHVQQALAAGARALTGGSRGGNDAKGFPYYEPTVLVDVDHSMDCMTEETFGPTLPIMRVEDEREAIRLANDSPYGLSASVWTKDLDRGHAVARELACGAVNVNDVIINMLSTTAPQSGWKTSGIGARFGGAAGLHKFCRTESVVTSRGPLKSEPMWYSVPRSVRSVGARALALDALAKIRHL